jgi:hypothetical protein
MYNYLMSLIPKHYGMITHITPGQTKGIVNHFNEVAENVIQKFNPSAKSLGH